MSFRDIHVRGRTVQLYESGTGNPLLYLHGIADMHGLSPDNYAFHDAMAEKHHVFAPAPHGARLHAPAMHNCALRPYQPAARDTHAAPFFPGRVLVPLCILLWGHALGDGWW